MLSRREILAGGALGSVRVGHAKASGEAAPPLAQPNINPEVLEELVEAVKSIESVLRATYLTPSLAYGPVPTLRKGFDTFLRSTGKFPDFCEVGISVFYDMYDWQIKNRQQVTVTRQPPDNRYTMPYMFTQLILRHEYDATYIGQPFDKG